MKKVLVIICSLFCIGAARAQQEHHHAQQDSTSSMNDVDIDMGSDHGMLMSHSYSLNLPMNRNGSGTSWLPDSSPTYMYLMGNNQNSVAIHGEIFIRYNNQDLFRQGGRGGIKWDAVTMVTGMYNRRIGANGLFNATAMLSADPYIMGGTGYPLLLLCNSYYIAESIPDF